MKILIDLTALADNFSGIERFAANISKEIIKENNNDYILLFKEEIHPLFTEFRFKKNIKNVVIHRSNKLFFNQIKLPIKIYKIKADCYLFLAFPVPILLFKKNMISTIHDLCCWDCPETMNGLSKYYYRISNRIAVAKCRNIITISKFSCERIKSKLKCPNDKIWIIYCGIENKFLMYKCNDNKDREVLNKYKIPQNYILSLCTLEPRKNLQLLIRAYSNLFRSGKISIPLVLAGRKGWKIEKIISEIDPIIKDKIIFTGFVLDEDLPTLYGNASLFIFPSLYEGFGLPPLEAMACGAKVLASDAACLPEILGNNVLYFKSNDCGSLEKALYSAVSDKKDLDVYKKKKHTEAFSWEKEGEKLLKKIINK